MTLLEAKPIFGKGWVGEAIGCQLLPCGYHATSLSHCMLQVASHIHVAIHKWLLSHAASLLCCWLHMLLLNPALIWSAGQLCCSVNHATHLSWFVALYKYTGTLP